MSNKNIKEREGLSIKLRKVENGLYTLPEELQQHAVELSPEYEDYLRRLYLRQDPRRYLRALLGRSPKTKAESR